MVDKPFVFGGSPESLFPPGTPVVVRQSGTRHGHPSFSEVVGVVETWEELATGSWFAHGRQDKLWLHRIKLRKADGEIALLVIDDSTSIGRLEAAKG